MAIGGGAHSTWGTRFGFLMAAIGSSVGLGNFWRFPYVAGENGGAAFIVIYLVCVVFIALPILMAELSVGRHARRSAVGSVQKMAFNAGAPGIWSVAGWVAMAGGIFILCFYSVVAGWVVAYVFQMATGQFMGLSTDVVAGRFEELIGDTNAVIGWHTAFMIVTVGIVSLGVTKGIERAVTILMPLFFTMLLALVIYAAFTADMGAALAYLFTPDFSEIGPQTFLAALGQAFFSIGVGSAIMITYGSYLPRTDNLAGSATIITGADTLVAIVAGLAIFPFVFAFALDPAAGPALFFQTLPSAFAQMPAGQYVGTAFFVLAFIAALTSSISLLQVVVAFAEEHTDFGRTGSAVFFGVIIWLVGCGAAFSGGFFDLLDTLSGSVFLPLGGLLIAVFTGWVVARSLMRHELAGASNLVFNIWRFLIRFLVPIAVFLILAAGIASAFGVSLPGLQG
ncbi:sodium:neurotransmitter symporter [Glycocaulis alkaliphilus]|uniref:Transporter n=1 Tax=Glycocaulis alkaliphilus TaxID=1434191 RepID=A0A3T0EA13_9PROT|nr:sodium-dependent transporter [Glycocaulis alkaliphilus]AZU03888.1 sodium:neurotransmitter symporter [Glycocaulis alkaliphilus]GGB85835.1 transporter [Glycocaulis alkaliphilus]